MKKKIDLFWYWFIFVVAFVLCFFAINDKKINAYQLDSNGNLIGDNLVDFSIYRFNLGGYHSRVTQNNDSNSNTLTIATTENSTHLSYGIVFYNIFNDLELDSEKEYTYYFEISSSLSNNYFTYGFEHYDGNSSCPGLIDNSQKTINRYTFKGSCVTEYNYNFIIYYRINNTDSYRSTFYVFRNMLYLGSDNVPYSPYEIFYSKQNYDSSNTSSYENGYNFGYDKGYEDGYNVGYTENNSIPTIYLENAIVYYNSTNPLTGGIAPMAQDITSSITNLNGTLNFNSFINLSWGSLVRDNQIFTIDINTLTPIGVNDVLRFSFNDISNSLNFSSKFSITFGNTSSCGADFVNCDSIVVLSYEDLVNSDFEIVLSEFKNNLSVTEFTDININFYRENGIMYGLTDLVDSSLLSDFDTQYDIGYKVGYINGNDAGLIEGEKLGYDKGYSVGYRKASQVVSDTGNNTLVGLASVIMGMPVNMLISIYNFEFLGVNLVSFFFSIITMFVCIWLIRKML